MANKMLLFLSKFNEDGTENIYDATGINGGKVRGTQTADAPTRYFLHYLKEVKEQDLEEILCITSSNTREYAQTKYTKMVKLYCEENHIKEPSITMIPYDYDDNETEGKKLEPNEKVPHLYKRLIAKMNEKDCLYIDYTNGLRDVSFLMVVLMRYMEFADIKVEKIIYSNNYDKRIYSVNYIYDLFHVINGINEFMQSGNVTTLHQILVKKSELAHQYPDIMDMVDNMKKFSDMMALCIVDKNIDGILENINSSIEKVSNLDTSKIEEDELAIRMLQDLLKQIQNKLSLKEIGTRSYVAIIKWCLENNMIQQATTFYIEKMPELYCKRNYISGLSISGKGQLGYSEAGQLFYNVLYDELGKEKGLVMLKRILDSAKQAGEEVENIVQSENLADYLKIITEASLWNERGVKEALELVQEYLNHRYSNRKVKGINPEVIEALNKSISAKTVSKAWNTICNNDGIHKMFFTNCVEKQETYPKKLETIKKLDELDITEYTILKNEELKVLMECYLAMKVIRNQINHANESDNIQCVEDYLKETGKDYSVEITVDNINTIIHTGLAMVESIEQRLKEETKQLATLGKVSFEQAGPEEKIQCTVYAIEDGAAFVRDCAGNEAEWKRKKMSEKHKQQLDNKSLLNQTVYLKILDQTSKRKAFMVQEA